MPLRKLIGNYADCYYKGMSPSMAADSFNLPCIFIKGKEVLSFQFKKDLLNYLYKVCSNICSSKVKRSINFEIESELKVGSCLKVVKVVWVIRDSFGEKVILQKCDYTLTRKSKGGSWKIAAVKSEDNK